MKIIGSDYDGTLNHKGIDDVKKQAIQKWRDAGNVFAVISGRNPKDLLRKYNSNIFPCDYLIANNGAVMMTPEGAVISSVKCDGEILKDFLTFAFKLGCCGAWIETEHPCRIYPDAKDCVNEHDYTMENMPHFESFNQISVRLSDFETASEVSKRIKEKFGDKLNPLQNDVIIDIVSAGVDKAQGLYILMKHLGAKYEDVIAVGDNVNDADMLREFKSYAMANGVDMIKELADGITVGITELIEKEMN